MEKVWGLENKMEENEELLRGFEKGVEHGKKRKRNEDSVEKGESGKMENKVRKVKVRRRRKKWSGEWSLPVLALENVFSFLDWKDLGTAMLVCKSWKEVGGHPSLWTRFPLRLTRDRLKNFPIIPRLDWVKSLDISMSIESMQLERLLFHRAMRRKQVLALGLLPVEMFFIRALLDSFPRLEELFIFCDNWDDYPDSRLSDFVLQFLEADNNKLVRVGTRSSYITSGDVDCCYYFSSCDVDSTTFLKRTLKKRSPPEDVTLLSIIAPPGHYLTIETLETACNITRENVFFKTNLLIDQNMDLRKLTCLLKDYICDLKWHVQSEDSEKQKVAPLNAILDLLGSEGNGDFEALHVSKKLLLKSNWVGRLGGRAMVEARDGDVINIFKTTSGLKMGLGWEEFDSDEEEEEDN